MKDKIDNLTFEAFKRWEETLGSKGIDIETRWKSLVQEAEKREPIVMYIVQYKNGGRHVCFDKEDAESTVKRNGGKVIKLQEVQE